MKNYPLHIIMYTFVVACLSGLTGKIAAEGIRIVPQSVTVKNDSLHLWLEMDLNSVHVNSLAAVIFTPELAGKKGSSQKITLPSVVITGSKRFRFERRERALATSAENREIPYITRQQPDRFPKCPLPDIHSLYLLDATSLPAAPPGNKRLLRPATAGSRYVETQPVGLHCTTRKKQPHSRTRWRIA